VLVALRRGDLRVPQSLYDRPKIGATCAEPGEGFLHAWCPQSVRTEGVLGWIRLRWAVIGSRGAAIGLRLFYLFQASRDARLRRERRWVRNTATMADYFGRAGRRADLAKVLHTTLVAHGMAPLDGSARGTIDEKVAQVAADMGISETAALKHFNERNVAELAVNTANEWHAAHVADEVAGDLVVSVPASAAGQLVMGLAMAVGQMVREVYGDLPASAGEPLDALCQLGSALRVATEPYETLAADVTLQTLTIAQRTLRVAAAGVADGSVPVIVAESARPHFAQQLAEDAQLARRLQP
jgi:hypothetical protein